VTTARVAAPTHAADEAGDRGASLARAGLVNDTLRAMIAMVAFAWGAALTVRHRLRLATYRLRQRRLRARYGVRPDTPVRPYGPEVATALAATAPARVRWAETSGATGAPKRIPYSDARLRQVRRAYVDAFARAFWSLPIGRTSLFVMGPLGTRRAEGDASLTALMLAERGAPPYLVTLQAPYRVQAEPVIQALGNIYGVVALRIWLLALSNPGVLYATNPSTLSTFFDRAAADWTASVALVRAFLQRPDELPARAHQLARRLASRGARARLARLAASHAPLPLASYAPGVEAYACWTGGYVGPFLERLAIHLPPTRYLQIPMYAMSTETIETVPHYRGQAVAFLPVAEGVLCEFIEEGRPDRPEELRDPHQLRPGVSYTLVVSDGHGLRRYQTGDVFTCRGFVRGLPDLAFVRRRDLEYSFTGEKLTALQVTTALDRLRVESEVAPDAFMTLIPSRPTDESVPHYRLIVAPASGDAPPAADAARLADRCEELLRAANAEYRTKIEDGRLAPVRTQVMTPDALAALIAGARNRGTWDAQLKFLPLHRRTMEELSESLARPG
jgi:hypothetical protein